MIKLESFRKEDFSQLIDWVENEHILMNWAGSLFSYPLSEESLDWYIEDTNDLTNSDAFVYKAIDTDTGKIVGHVSIGSVSRKNRSARISRVLVGNTEERGKGVCQQMINAILKFGFEYLELHRVSLGVYSFNTSAIRCYEKCGFVSEGVQRDVLQYKPGEWWSLLEMSILEDEWRKINYRKDQEAKR